MRDKILDFIEDHRILVIISIVLVVLIIIGFGIRSHNLSKKQEESQQESIEQELQSLQEAQETTEEETTAGSSYKSSLNTRDKVEERLTNVQVTQAESETVVELKPNFIADFEIFDKTEVPDKNVDGSSYKAYLKGVSLKDFGSKWGSRLDINDMKTETRYMIGVEQDENNREIADLQSVGWLIDNLSKLNKHSAVKFTNLHVIGSLSDNHVAVLCSYDWYSAYGLKDTMVLFEDISKTLKPSDFKDGSIFYATVFVHNIKIKNVNGQDVVCIQYNIFK